jgi:hypothetical protein
MTDSYENFLGPIHPGFYKSPSPKNQKSYREREEQLEQDECSATFVVSHPTFDSTKITELLDLEPDYVLEDGDTLYQSERYHIRSPGCIWRHELYKRGRRFSAEDLLSELLDDLSGKLPNIRWLQSEGASMKIQMIFDQRSNLAFLDLTPELLIRLGQ